MLGHLRMDTIMLNITAVCYSVRSWMVLCYSSHSALIYTLSVQITVFKQCDIMLQYSGLCQLRQNQNASLPLSVYRLHPQNNYLVCFHYFK